jgi:hypothetical protein
MAKHRPRVLENRLLRLIFRTNREKATGVWIKLQLIS